MSTNNSFVKTINPAILFEPDGYVMSGEKLMGRQAAGNAFLRAAVKYRKNEVMTAYTPHHSSAQYFAKLINQLDSNVQSKWIAPHNADALSTIGTLYLPGPGLTDAANLRLRSGLLSYSLTGVTHTTASHNAMDAIVGILGSTVMPWDALICTSSAVLNTVEILLDHQKDYLKWMYGPKLEFQTPQLPVIPLGVHVSDYDFQDNERIEARNSMEIHGDELVILFVGRLSFHAKAHPHPMYVGLQALAKKTGKKISLIQSGWFANQAIQDAFVTAAKDTCPDVRMIFTDGKNSNQRRASWAVADIFISLSDNIQETFGLTPIEAMSAGLPVIVTDWDGYKDTVREGIDGYRIPTWMPLEGRVDNFAKYYEAEAVNYDMYCGYTCQTVSLDVDVLVERLVELAQNAALRKNMGQAGRQRAREVFDWSVIYAQYQSLWSELDLMREHALSNQKWMRRLKSVPKELPSRMDPFKSFQHYPSSSIDQNSKVLRYPHASLSEYQRLVASAIFSYAKSIMPDARVASMILDFSVTPISVSELAEKCGIEVSRIILFTSLMAKMALIRYQNE